MSEDGPKTYDAFISYSHAADGAVVQRLQEGLQRLAKPWYGRRSLHVFRDATGLSVTPQLWSSICGALDGSRYFILMASPDAARSEWVGREIERWLSRESPDQILPVLTHGEICWDDAAGDFDWTRSSALHPMLRGVFHEEPLYLDLRWAVEESDLDLRNPRFREAVAELAAPIHGIPKEDLEGEDLREQRKLRRAARGGVSVLAALLVVAVALGVVALVQRGRAIRDADAAARAARAAEARELGADALNQLHDGRNGLALLLAAQGNRLARSPSVSGALLSALRDEAGLYRDFEMGSDGVGELAFSPDAKLLAADYATHVRLWSVASGKRLGEDLHPKHALNTDGLSFGDRGRLLAVSVYRSGGGATTSLDVLDTNTGATLHSLSQLGAWTTSAETPRIAVSDASGYAIWDGRTGRLVRRITAPDHSGFETLALSRDGSTLAAATVLTDFGTGNSSLEVLDAWNIDSGERLPTECRADAGGPFVGDFHMAPVAPSVMQVTIDPSNTAVRTMMSGGTRAISARCDLASGASAVTTVNVGTTPEAPVAGVSADGTSVATRDTTDGTIRLFDATSGMEIRSAVRQPPFSPYEYSGVVFSPDGRLMAAPGSSIGEVKLWRTRTIRDTLEHAVQIPPETTLTAISPHAALLAVTGADGNSEIIDHSTGRVRIRIPGTPAIAFPGDGRFVASLTRDAQSGRASLALWTLRTGNRREVSLPTNVCASSVDAVAVASDAGTLLVGCTTFSDRKWSIARVDLSSATPRLSSKAAAEVIPDSLTLSPDGRFVIAGEQDRAGGAFELLELAGGRLRHRLTVPADGAGMGPVAFRHDGTTFATAFGDGRLELWRVSSHTARATQLGAGRPTRVTSLAFSPDGSILAVGGCAGVQLWDVATATLLGTLRQGPECIDTLTFSTDGGSVIASFSGASPSGSLVRLDIDVATWVADACAIVNRNLTPDEWARVLPDTPYRATCPRSS